MSQKHRAHVYLGYATACNISIKTRNTVTEEYTITPELCTPTLNG